VSLPPGGARICLHRLTAGSCGQRRPGDPVWPLRATLLLKCHGLARQAALPPPKPRAARCCAL